MIGNNKKLRVASCELQVDKRKWRRFLTLFFLTLDIGLWTLDSSHAIELTLRLERNKILLGENVVLEVAVIGSSGGLGEPKLAIPPELPVYSQSKSQKIEVINWKMTTSVAYTLVLGSSKAGTFKLGPAKIDVGGGQVIESNTVALEVEDQKSSQVPGTPQGYMRPFSQPNFPRSVQDMVSNRQQPSGSAPTAQNNNEPPATQPRSKSSNEPPLIFIEAKTDKKEAFIGEPVKYSVYFYSRVPFASQPQYVPPNISGFWHEELIQRTATTQINGVAYSVTELPLMLFATTSGKLQIGSAKIQVEIENLENPNSMDPFDPQFIQRFFGMGSTQSQILESKPISIEIKPLPEASKPKDFSGAVGQFELKAELDKNQAKVGESLILTVTVSGNGNIRNLPSPTYPNLEGLFRSYETEKSETISKDKGQISGIKTYKLLLIPQIPGQPSLTISPIRFVYFDPLAKGYVRRETPPINVTVTGEPMRQDTNDGSSPQTKEIAQDINYIIEQAPHETAWPNIAHAIAQRWIWPASIPAILWLSSMTVATVRRRRQNAKKNSRSLLAKALEDASSQSDSPMAVSQRLTTYLEESLKETFALDAQILSTKKLEGAPLTSHKNLTPQDLILISQVVQKLHFIRFAPGKPQETQLILNDTLPEIKKILDILANAQKKKRQ